MYTAGGRILFVKRNLSRENDNATLARYRVCRVVRLDFAATIARRGIQDETCPRDFSRIMLTALKDREK